MNSFFKRLMKTAYNLGDHNDPLNAVLAIALFKGINRPLFTMMDKDSDPQVKKYAAFREGLTEVIAATTYVVTNRVLAPLAKPLANKTGGSAGKIKNGIEFLSVCLSAAVLIPAVCNVTLNPVMKGIAKLNNDLLPFKKRFHLTENKTYEKLDIKEPESPDFDSNEELAPLPAVKDGVKMPSGPNSLLHVLQHSYNPSMKGGFRI